LASKRVRPLIFIHPTIRKIAKEQQGRRTAALPSKLRSYVVVDEQSAEALFVTILLFSHLGSQAPFILVFEAKS
jgi:hypothetical protein